MRIARHEPLLATAYQVRLPADATILAWTDMRTRQTDKINEHLIRPHVTKQEPPDVST